MVVVGLGWTSMAGVHCRRGTWWSCRWSWARFRRRWTEVVRRNVAKAVRSSQSRQPPETFWSVVSSVTRWWNKKLPNFSQYCPKSSLYLKVILFKIALKFTKIFGLLFKIFLPRSEKMPNLVTLNRSHPLRVRGPSKGRNWIYWQTENEGTWDVGTKRGKWNESSGMITIKLFCHNWTAIKL